MQQDPTEQDQHNYPAAYWEGVRLFNEHQFFECHDVLEELWTETIGDDKEFYQGLIQAAVALFHFENNNLTGARKMVDNAIKRLTPYGSVFMGMQVEQFLDDMKHCFAELLSENHVYPTGVTLSEKRIPQMIVNKFSA